MRSSAVWDTSFWSSSVNEIGITTVTVLSLVTAVSSEHLKNQTIKKGVWCAMVGNVAVCTVLSCTHIQEIFCRFVVSGHTVRHLPKLYTDGVFTGENLQPGTVIQICDLDITD
jgi:hypothetical protein